MAVSESISTPAAPVSRALEQEVRAELVNGIRVWLDTDASYTEFVDRLRAASHDGKFDPVVAYRGSFLELLFELESKTAGLTSGPLLIHMPGFNEESIRETPVLPYYLAGSRYRRKLETLVENAAAAKVDPDEIESFLSGGVASLEEADRWLASHLTKHGSQLGQLTLMELWIRLQNPSEAGAIDENPKSVLTHIRTRVAMDKNWLEETGLQLEFDAQTEDNQWRIIGDILLSWSMALEYVNDLKREPITSSLIGLPDLNRAYSRACTEFVQNVRTNEAFQTDYIRVANDFEGKLVEEVSQGEADELGEVDTFRFEDQRLMVASLERLVAGQGEDVREWAELRRPEHSIWLRDSPERASTWELIRAGARLSLALDRHRDGLTGVKTLAGALERYRDELYEVDFVHRRLEQERVRLLRPSLPQFSRVRAMLDSLRARHCSWCDRVSREFANLCEQAGFLPGTDLQQRSLFEQVVRPRVNERDRLVFFMVDGLRFEMARDLIERLDAGEANVKLDARFAELPSATPVGMNLLAPVASHGRVSPLLETRGGTLKFSGFQTNAFQVRTPETRRRTMFKRVGGHDCPLLRLDEVNAHPNLNNVVRGYGLAVVHSLDLDESGEAGHGVRTFDNILMHISSAIRLLRKAGVKRFVIASDHGFLLHPNSEPAGGNGSGRYMVADAACGDADTTSVALSELGYDGVSQHLVLSRDTRCLGKSSRPDSYVHGGNSLQERVIPVLSLEYGKPSGGSSESFLLEAKKVNIAGVNRVELFLRRQQQALAFASNERFEFTLQPRHEDLRLEVVEIGPHGELAGEATVRIQPGIRYMVDFVIDGSQDTRAPIRIVPLGSHDQVESVEPDEFFEVVGSGPSEEADVLEAASASRWDAIEDESVREVLEHLDKHGSVTEAEATRMLGGARQFRRFSRKIKEWQRFLAFDIIVEAAASGKRYVKE